MSSARRSPQPARETPFAGLRFAVYARKSNEDDRNEDNRSTGRQVEQARAWVERQGGAVLPDQVYKDDCVSGAEFKSRPGLLRFLDALRNGKPFNAVVMSEQSRLGREQLETGYLLKQIRDAGVRVFYYLTGEEARLDSALSKIMSSLTSFAAEMEREKARQRARDAAARKARSGHVTGGEPYGYENVHYQGEKEVPHGQLHDYVGRRVKPDEAEVVRGIFRMYAAGWGLIRIAKAMNNTPAYSAQNREFFGGQRVPPPRRRTGSWSPTAIREMLYRRLYHGEIVWGQTTHTDRDGRAGLRIPLAQSEWLIIPAPDLKIIADDLWNAVQARLQAAQAHFLRDGRGKLWSKPDLRREGQYLLTGLARCGVCGWKLSVLGGHRRVYGCSHSLKRGVCENRLMQPVDMVDTAFLRALEREVLTPERFRFALECGVNHLRKEMTQQPNRRPALERERAALAAKIARMVAAIGDGNGPSALVQEIAKAGGQAEASTVDALDSTSVEEHLRGVVSKAGRLDISFNLISTDVAMGVPLVKLGDDDFSAAAFQRPRSYFITMTAAARVMMDQGSGVILGLTAPNARIPRPNMGGFAIGGAAIEALCRQLALEAGPRGVRVVCLRTGGTPDNPVLQEVFSVLAKLQGTTAEAVALAEAQVTALKRPPLLREVANAAVLMASDYASAITATAANASCGELVE